MIITAVTVRDMLPDYVVAMQKTRACVKLQIKPQRVRNVLKKGRD